MQSKYFTGISVITAVAAVAMLAAASTGHADENPEVLARMIKSGEIISWEAAEKRAKELHPGARVTEIDLDKNWTSYVYELEVRDPEGFEWDIDMDAKTGKVIMQDREYWD